MSEFDLEQARRLQCGICLQDRKRKEQMREEQIRRDERDPVKVKSGWDDLFAGKVH